MAGHQFMIYAYAKSGFSTEDVFNQFAVRVRRQNAMHNRLAPGVLRVLWGCYYRYSDKRSIEHYTDIYVLTYQ